MKIFVGASSALVLFALSACTEIPMNRPEPSVSQSSSEPSITSSPEQQPHKTVASESCSAEGCSFSSPSRHIYCLLEDNDALQKVAICRWIDLGPPIRGHEAYLAEDGSLNTRYFDPGDAALCRTCFQNGLDAPVLGYGATATFGPLICSSSTDGFLCRTNTIGHGFKINASGIYPV